MTDLANDADSDGEVRASACALAIAFPLTRAQFFTDLESGDDRCFARSYLPKLPSAHERWTAYEPTASAIRGLLVDVERLGAKVVTRANADHLHELLHERGAVTLVAHTWLFHPVTKTDILDARTLLSALHHPTSLLRAALRDRLSGPAPTGVDEASWAPLQRLLADPRLAASSNDDDLRAALSLGLSSLVAEARDRFNHPHLPARASLDEVALRPWSRPALEGELSKHLVPAKQIELSGQMITTGELVRAIPRSFSGVLDVSACNSLFLVEPIKRAAPRSTVVWGRMQASILPCVQRCFFTLRELQRAPSSYSDAILRVTAAFKPR